MKLIHEAQTKRILQEKCCAINAYETYILYAGLNQIPACWLKKGFYFLSILYAFWFFDDRQPWNIDHVGYPATDKNKKHFPFFGWVLIAAYPTRLPLKKAKRREKTVFSMFDLQLLLSSSPKKKSNTEENMQDSRQ